MAKYRVLSLDGGGLRGLISIVLMQRLSAEPGLESWLSQVDLVAGTSTGLPPASHLACPLRWMMLSGWMR